MRILRVLSFVLLPSSALMGIALLFDRFIAVHDTAITLTNLMPSFIFWWLELIMICGVALSIIILRGKK